MQQTKPLDLDPRYLVRKLLKLIFVLVQCLLQVWTRDTNQFHVILHERKTYLTHV